VLTASRLTRRFGTRVAVDDASFEIRKGEIFALLGPNGAGKTTTLRMLAGLIEPTSGEVRIGNEPLGRGNAPRLRARVGFLTESPGLWDRLTVTQNLSTYAQLLGVRSPRTRVDEVLQLFSIAERRHDVTATLSKGLRQRVALARTLLHNPEIVLLDEPTSGLDPESAHQVRELVLRLRDEKHAVLLCTHNLDEVERMATRVAVLRQRLVAVDTPAGLRRRLFGSRVRVLLQGSPQPFTSALAALGLTDVTTDERSLSVAVASPEEETPAIVEALVAQGARIVQVVPETPSLEQIYLTLIDEERAS